MGSSAAHLHSALSHFSLGLFKWNSIQIRLDLNSSEFCPNLVIECNGFRPLNSNERSELGFQIQVNVIKQIRKYTYV
jgi:hypothetical protein